ncbi:hypothetical protein E2320_016665, partial [Naja naja]
DFLFLLSVLFVLCAAGGSVRRAYIINKEICSRIVCKEDEVMQEEMCRWLAGLPPLRLRRSNEPRGPSCRQAKGQSQNMLDSQ